jgi:hypothetical protein
MSASSGAVAARKDGALPASAVNRKILSATQDRLMPLLVAASPDDGSPRSQFETTMVM